jgi:hypothetical protein
MGGVIDDVSLTRQQSFRDENVFQGIEVPLGDEALA